MADVHTPISESNKSTNSPGNRQNLFGWNVKAYGEDNGENNWNGSYYSQHKHSSPNISFTL